MATINCINTKRIDFLIYGFYRFTKLKKQTINKISFMLSCIRLVQRFYIRHTFKVDTFTAQDYKTMCHLLKQKYLIHNDDIRIFKDVKLLDENNKLIGIYPASEARKKAYSMKKDITLLNSMSDPVICKVLSFRNDLLNKFFDEIVNKHNEKLLSKANATKQLKIALNLNQNELKVKAKQIIELSKKNLNVRVFMNCKEESRDECLEKLQFLKSEIQGKCMIDKQIKNYRDEEPQQGKSYTQTYSFTCKSRENQFTEMIKQSSQKAPDEAISNFLKKYYKQDDVDMLDLKVTGRTIAEDITNASFEEMEKKVSNMTTKVDSRTKGKGIWKDQQADSNSTLEREAKARILNERLKVILGWTL